MSVPLPPLQQIPPHLFTIADYQKQAQLHLNPQTWAYLEGGAMDEHSLNHNLESYRKIQLLPRHLTNLHQLDLSLNLFGQRYAHPIFLAPIAYQKLFHPHAEIATALAAEAMQANMILSNFSTTAMQEVAQTSQSPKWFQLYWQGSREKSLDLIQQAQQAGFLAIVITIDSAFSGIRDQERQSGFQLPAHLHAVHHNPLPLETSDLQGLMQLAAQWDDIAWLRQHIDLPILLKGIIHPLDAKQAIDLGVHGLILSNHGGRILDGVISPLEVLAKIRAMTSSNYPLILDSGIRRGTDIFKALALGASAVSVGRPYIYGLASAGALGIAHSLKILIEEFSTTMALMGTTKLDQINQDCIFHKN